MVRSLIFNLKTKFTKLKFYAIILLSILFTVHANAQNLTADLIIVNAKVRTMNGAKPNAEAVAVMGNRIVAVGINADIRAQSNAQTRTIDAKGKLILPGFNNSHLRFLEGRKF